MLMRNNDWTRRFLGEILKAGADVSRATETQRQVIKVICFAFEEPQQRGKQNEHRVGK